MRSKPGSRLAQVPSSSNLTPKLKSKLEALQGKYHEFMSNCASIFEEDSKAKVSPNPRKRESQSEFLKESEKLRRENTFLARVVNDLSDKITNLEGQQSESLILKNFEEKLESKKKLLERQEQEMCSLQRELEKTRVELNSIKKQHKEAKEVRSRTPAFQPIRGSVTRSMLRLAKPKDYSPINRNRTGSPISRSVSPKERKKHEEKVKISQLQNELQKTIEERNLYKSWKDYCSKNPVVPPGISSIVSHYEVELRKATSINSILKSKVFTLEKALKDTLADVEKLLKVRRSKNLEDLASRLKENVQNNDSDIFSKSDSFGKIQKLEVKSLPRLSSIDSEVLRLSSSRQEKENKDLEEILRRENLIADLYSEAVKVKSEEVETLRNTFSTIYSFDRVGGTSSVKAGESLSEGFSVIGTPFGKNSSFELSFAPKPESPKTFETLKHFEKLFESVVVTVENSLHSRIDQIQTLACKLGKVLKVSNEKVEKKWQIQEIRDKWQECEEERLKCQKELREVQGKIIESQTQAREMAEKQEKERKGLLQVVEDWKNKTRVKDKDLETLKLALEEKEKLFEQREIENSQLKTQEQSLKNLLFDKNQEISLVSEQLKEKNSKVSALLKENQDLREKNQQIQAELQKKIDEVLKKNSEIDEKKDEIEEKKDEIQEKILMFQEMFEEKEKAEKELKLLENDFDECLRKNEELTQKLSLETEKNKKEFESFSKVSSEAAIFKQKFKESEFELTQVKKNLEVSTTHNELIEKLKKEDLLKTSEILQLKESLQNLQNRVKILDQQLKESQETQENLKNLQESFKNQEKLLKNQEELEKSLQFSKIYSAELLEKLSHLEKLQENYDQIVKIKEKTDEDLVKNTETLKIFESQLKKHVENSEKLESEKKTLERLYSESQLTVEKLKKSLKDFKTQCDHYEQTITDLSASLDEKEEETKALKLQQNDFYESQELLENYKSKISILQGFHKENEKLAEDKMNEISSLLENIEKQNQVIKELRGVYEENLILKSEKMEVIQKIEDLDRYSAALNQDLQDTRNECLSLTAENEKLKENFASFEAQMKTLTLSKDSVIESIQQKLLNIEDLSLDLQKKSAKCQSLKQKIKSLTELHSNLLIENETLLLKLKNTSNFSSRSPENLEILTLPDTISINPTVINSKQVELSLDSFKISVLPEKPSIFLYFSQLFDIELTPDSINRLKESIQNSSYKLKLLENAYKKLETEFSSFKSHSQDKQDDLKLEKYELSKENDDLKKRNNSLAEESRQNSSELIKKDQKTKEILQEKCEIEHQLLKLSSDLSEKSKKIQELTQEATNSSNYVQKLLKEKESIERNLEIMTRNVISTQASLDNSQIRTEISALRAQYSKLDSINSSLEQTKSSLDQKLKKTLQEKSEILEKQEDLMDQIENLKQIRSNQSSQIAELETRMKELGLEAEQDKRQIIEYKNKLATYMRNTTALEKELRSMTPPPRRDLVPDSSETSPTRVCHTADSTPSLSIEKSLSKLKSLLQHPVPESVLSWCKEVLGQENFIVRFQDSSLVSDESHLSDISSVSEANVQEGNYRAHSKMLEQQKTIQKLQTRLNDKKSRLKMFKGHIRTLQEEIRRLDQELKTEKSLDLEHFKSIFQKFVSSLKNVDNESLKILQVLTGVLGVETLPRVDSKKKWSLFAKKSK